MAKVHNNATDLITFARSSSGTALRRVGYGENLVDNDDFTSGLTSWEQDDTAFSVVGDELVYDASGSGTRLGQAVNFTAGKVYELTVDATISSTFRAQLVDQVSNDSGAQIILDSVSTGANTVVFVANSSFTYLVFRRVVTVNNSTLDNVSVKEVIFDRATDPLVLFNHPDDTPRIEYGSDGALKGLLIEEQRTNLFNYSNDPNLVDGGGGDAGLTVSANTEDDPAGSAAASIITAQYTNSFFGPRYTSGATGQVYTASFIVKNNGSAQSRIFVRNSVDAADITVSWDGATLTSTTDTSGSSSTEPLGGNYYKISVTYTATEGTQKPRIYPDTSDGSNSLVVYAWQLEEGSFATSYIPTSGSQQTRSADVASIPVSAFGYNQDAGTVVVEAQVADTSVSNAGDLRIKTTVGHDITNSGSRVGGFPAGSYVVYSPTTNILMRVDTVLGDGQPYKAAYGIAESNSAISVNGSSVVIDQTTTLAGNTASLFELGKNFGFLNGHIKSLKYYPRRLTNAQLQELTA